MLITTTDTLQGREIKEYLGIVHGYGQDVSGGIGKMGDKLMAKTMDSLQESLTAAGNAVNADAIIGVRVFSEKGYVKAVGTTVKL